MERERARDWARQARALSDTLAMRPLAARCRVTLGLLERDAGRPREAEAWLAAGAAELRAMGIVRRLAHVEALLAGSFGAGIDP
jgi:hypothetical protein